MVLPCSLKVSGTTGIRIARSNAAARCGSVIPRRPLKGDEVFKHTRPGPRVLSALRLVEEHVVDDLTRLSANEMAKRVASKDISPVELIDAVLALVDRLNPSLVAFITCDSEGARSAARSAEKAVMQGEDVGRLHGVPVAVKDVIPVAGMRLTYGSQRYVDHYAQENAVLVERMLGAGAIVVGKTNTPEFAAYMNTTNRIAGTTLNPWDLRLSSGGSSGGSAVAVATGMAALAIGTDHGGSIRFPAAFNGVLGLRPTPGLIPVYPSPWVYDEFDVHGPLARSVEDLDLCLSVLAGPDDRVPISRGGSYELGAYLQAGDIDRYRIAWTPDLGGLFHVDPEVRSLTEAGAQHFAHMGAQVESASPAMQDAVEAIRPLRMMRALIEHADRLDDRGSIDNVLLRGSLDAATSVSARFVAEGQAARSRAWLRNASFFSTYDLLVLPATQVAGFGKDELAPTHIAGIAVDDALSTAFATYAISMLGWPSLSIPCGFTAAGLPVGLQLVAARGNEALLLRAASAFARSRSSEHDWPPVVGETPVDAN